MKWFIYTLLLINIGLFAWHFQPNADSQRSQIDNQHTRLVLLKEYEQQLDIARDEKGVPRCYSLGPFTRKDSFNQARMTLKNKGVEVFSRVSSEKVRKGFWVMLPVSGSHNQAKLKIQQLKEKGVNDYFLVAAGEMKNAISLGVFSKAKLAKRRQQDVEKLGFVVKTRQITLPKRVYWLEWPRYAEQQPDRDWLDKTLGKYRGIGQVERRCLVEPK